MFNINKEEILKDLTGSFNGETFIGTDGGEYGVPLNYASKSGLVEGDILRLVIRNDGEFVFKQIKKVDRKSLLGIMKTNERGAYIETKEGDYRILPSSVSYFKAKEGDEAIVVVPRDFSATYGSLKAIIKRNK